MAVTTERIMWFNRNGEDIWFEGDLSRDWGDKKDDYAVSDSNSKEELQDPTEERIGPSIILFREEKTTMRKPWRHSLIIKLMGKIVGYKFLINSLLSLWKPVNSLDVVDIGKDFYIARFGSKDDNKHALTGCLWLVADHYLLVQQWEPHFDP